MTSENYEDKNFTELSDAQAADNQKEESEMKILDLDDKNASLSEFIGYPQKIEKGAVQLTYNRISLRFETEANIWIPQLSRIIKLNRTNPTFSFDSNLSETITLQMRNIPENESVWIRQEPVNVERPDGNTTIWKNNFTAAELSVKQTVAAGGETPTPQPVNHWTATVCASQANSVTLQAGPSKDDNDVFAEWRRGDGQKTFNLPSRIQSLGEIYFKVTLSNDGQTEVCVKFDGVGKKHFSLDEDPEDHMIKSSDGNDDDCIC